MRRITLAITSTVLAAVTLGSTACGGGEEPKKAVAVTAPADCGPASATRGKSYTALPNSGMTACSFTMQAVEMLMASADNVKFSAGPAIQVNGGSILATVPCGPNLSFPNTPTATVASCDGSIAVGKEAMGNKLRVGGLDTTVFASVLKVVADYMLVHNKADNNHVANAELSGRLAGDLVARKVIDKKKAMAIGVLGFMADNTSFLKGLNAA